MQDENHYKLCYEELMITFDRYITAVQKHKDNADRRLGEKAEALIRIRELEKEVEDLKN